MNEQLAPAPMWNRFAALMVDDGVIRQGANIVGILIGVSFALISPDSSRVLVYAVATVAAVVLGAVLEVPMVASRRQASIGKILLSMQVHRIGGGRVGAGRSILRYVVKMVGTFALGLGLLVALTNPQRRALHDLVAGTIVVAVPSAPGAMLPPLTTPDAS